MIAPHVCEVFPAPKNVNTVNAIKKCTKKKGILLPGYLEEKK